MEGETGVCFKGFVTWVLGLRNFFSICSGGINQSVVEGFWVGRFQYKRRAKRSWNFRDPKGDKKKLKFFPKGST